MAGHAQLKFVMPKCSKTQIRLTGLISYITKYDYGFITTVTIGFGDSSELFMLTHNTLILFIYLDVRARLHSKLLSDGMTTLIRKRPYLHVVMVSSLGEVSI